MDLYRYPSQVFIPDEAVTRTEDGRLLADWLGEEFEIVPDGSDGGGGASVGGAAGRAGSPSASSP